MSENRQDYAALNGDHESNDGGNIIKHAVNAFGIEKLTLIVRLFLEISADTKYGAIEVIICDGKIQTIKKVSSYK